MGAAYTSVQWNRQKRFYDFALGGGVALYLLAFGAITKFLFPFVTEEILLMRAFGTAAFLLLHIILCIGPLCRLNPKFLPLLYNRRHAGVTCFLLALIHAVLVVATYHAGGDINPILSIFVSSPLIGSVAGVPFQPFGFFALVILFLLAATSHDFWLANLTAPVWKGLHMAVYFAFLKPGDKILTMSLEHGGHLTHGFPKNFSGMLYQVVSFGTLQGETSWFYVAAMAVGLLTVLSLHIAAARKEIALDGQIKNTVADKFVDACAVADIAENRARIVCMSGERVAIFKYDGKISAVSNVCQHQNGPLGEGKIVAGCITCPWHGYQYVPETGASPPPFAEKVPTFNIRVKNGRVWIDPKPNPAGSRAEPALIET